VTVVRPKACLRRERSSGADDQRRRALIRWSAAIAGLLSCGPTLGNEAGNETDEEGTTTGSTASTVASGDTRTASSSAAETAGEESSDGMECVVGFDVPADSCPESAFPCDPLNDACPPNTKCTPKLGGDYACTPLAPRPMQLYEPCDGESDDCDRGLYCNGRYCVGICLGCYLEPHCSDPIGECLPDYGYCLVPCDPLVDECPGEDVCVPSYHFYCTPPGPQSLGEGEACSSGYADECAPGLVCCDGAMSQEFDYCADHTRIPGCPADAAACCGRVCDPEDGDSCTRGLVCEPVLANDPCLAEYGICRLP
jgi:hypothetical protein